MDDPSSFVDRNVPGVGMFTPHEHGDIRGFCVLGRGPFRFRSGAGGETGIDREQVWIAMRALHDAGYVDAYLASAHSGFVQSVGERTRRELGSITAPHD